MIANKFNIDNALRDQKVMLKSSLLYSTYISLGLISISFGLYLVKSEELAPLKRKFLLHPPPLVADRLKKKHELAFLKPSSLEGKSQNMGSSTKGLVDSPAILGSSSTPHLSGRVTQSSPFAFKGKSVTPFDLIDLIGNVEAQEGSIKFEASRAERT